MKFLTMGEIIAEFDHLDDLDVLEQAKTNRALDHALRLTRPVNWHGSGLSPEQIMPLALDSGIPIVWVPPAPVLQELVAAPQEERLAVVLAHRHVLLDEGRALVAECSDPWLRDPRVLTDRALDAFEAGHHEAAMALAVAVGEPLALWASIPRAMIFSSEAEKDQWYADRKAGRHKYKLAKLELDAATEAQQHEFDVPRRALIAPIPSFFVPFFGGDDEAIPQTVSRHATVHKPTVEHFSVANALLALMLATSILRDQQEYSDEVRADDARGEEL